MGSRDEIPESLEQLEYEITPLSDEDIDNLDLSQFDVLICGIRAFNVRNNLDRQQKKINELLRGRAPKYQKSSIS